MALGFILVFLLPELDVEFASGYFSAVAMINLSLIFGTPLGVLVQRDIVKGNPYEKYLLTMIMNIVVVSIIFNIINNHEIAFTVLSAVLIGLVYYLKGALIGKNQIRESYVFNIVRGFILPVGALISVHFANNFQIFTLLLVFVFILLVSWQWKNLRYCRLPSFQEYIRISRSTLYLSGSSSLIWLFYQLPRLQFFQLESTDTIMLVQSMSVPLALLSIYEARGPYLLNNLLRSEARSFAHNLGLLASFYGLSYLAFWLLFSFMERFELLTYINFYIAGAFFGLSFLLSCHFELVRRLFTVSDEKTIFNIFFPTISLYGIGSFVFLKYFNGDHFSLLIALFLVCYLPAVLVVGRRYSFFKKIY
jgi:uncharacterized membrane protein YesL